MVTKSPLITVKLKKESVFLKIHTARIEQEPKVKHSVEHEIK